MRFRFALRGSLGRTLRRSVGAALFLSSLAGLAACTTTTGPIIPTGEPGRYTLTSRSGGLTTSWVQLKSQALDRAREFCTSQGMKMTEPDVSSNHATGLTRPMTYVTFTCSPIPQPKNAQQDQGEQNK
ncbi:Lipoprotein [Bordetella sputigena]|uniref:hypothetical protein n=1 Tax=Bordetella sputigena TaxID=1416810 RepID=UPI0039F0F10B